MSATLERKPYFAGILEMPHGNLELIGLRDNRSTITPGGSDSHTSVLLRRRAREGDSEARSRLDLSTREMRVHGELDRIETRATNTGSFADLVILQYVVDYSALVLRNVRPLANAVMKRPLPQDGTTFQIPRGTTGATTAIQATDNTNVSSTDEVFANVTLPVATIAGQQDVSRQSLEAERLRDALTQALAELDSAK